MKTPQQEEIEKLYQSYKCGDTNSVVLSELIFKTMLENVISQAQQQAQEETLSEVLKHEYLEAEGHYAGRHIVLVDDIKKLQALNNK